MYLGATDILLRQTRSSTACGMYPSSLDRYKSKVVWSFGCLLYLIESNEITSFSCSTIRSSSFARWNQLVRRFIPEGFDFYNDELTPGMPSLASNLQRWEMYWRSGILDYPFQLSDVQHSSDEFLMIVSISSHNQYIHSLLFSGLWLHSLYAKSAVYVLWLSICLFTCPQCIKSCWA